MNSSDYLVLDTLQTCDSAKAIGQEGVNSEELFQGYSKFMDVNVKDPLMMCHYAAPHLIESKGAIVNVSSLTSFRAVCSLFKVVSGLYVWLPDAWQLFTGWLCLFLNFNYVWLRDIGWYLVDHLQSNIYWVRYELNELPRTRCNSFRTLGIIIYE